MALTASPLSIATGPTGSHQLPSTSMPLKIPQCPSVNGVGPAASPGADAGGTAITLAASRAVANVPSGATVR